MLQYNAVCHFEEPCPYWALEQTREVREAPELDVTGGEQDCYLPMWQHMIAMHAVDIVQPRPHRAALRPGSREKSSTRPDL